MSSTNPLNLEAEHDAGAMYSHRSLVVVEWRRAPSLDDVARMTQSLQRVVRRAQQPMVMATIIRPDQRAPDAEVRAALQRGIRDLDRDLVAAVNIIQGTGFQAAAMRAFLTGLAMIARQKHRVAFVADAKAASGFILAHWPASDAPPPAQQVLESALAELIMR